MFVLGVSKVLSEGVNKICRKKYFIGVSATESREKSRNFRYGFKQILFPNRVKEKFISKMDMGRGVSGNYRNVQNIPLIIDNNLFVRLTAEIVTRRWERTEMDLLGNVHGPGVEYWANLCIFYLNSKRRHK